VQNVTANFETSEALGREDATVAAPLRPEPLPHSSVPVAAVSPWSPPAAAPGVVVGAVGVVPAPAVPGMPITPAMPAPAPAAAPTTPIDILYVGAEGRLFQRRRGERERRRRAGRSGDEHRRTRNGGKRATRYETGDHHFLRFSPKGTTIKTPLRLNGV